MSYTDLDIEGGSDYFKLTAGTIVTFHILSETPTKSLIHWIDKKKSTCMGKNCTDCADGNIPKQRWTLDAWDRKDQRVKKLEFGSMIASQFKAIAEMLAESQKTIHDIDIRIKTTGSGLETNYSVLNVPMPVENEIPKEITDKYSVPF